MHNAQRTMMIRNNPIEEKSFAFSVRIVRLYKHLTQRKHEYVLSKQILRSGTSIGANIREAKYAHSKADFVARLQISLKECYETEYWIEIAQKANIIPEDIAKTILHDCGSIRRMLIASINTAKENKDG